jgi:predicted nucleotidyltransferase
MISINNQLTNLASTYYLSPGSSEGSGIQISVNHLTAKINTHFGSSIKTITRFGSSIRGTILPRKYDKESDVDIMIVFNYSQTWEATPRSLRERLLNFAKKYYPYSTFYRSRPVVVLELDHIQYDLVPAIVTNYGYSFSTTYIPDNDTSWQITDPTGFNQTLTDANVRYGSVVKPIIRLLKTWNSKAGFPIQPYALEQEVARMSFAGDNVEKGFFWAIAQLSDYSTSYSLYDQQRIRSLKSHAERVKNALADNNAYSAQLWLGHILPL